MPEENLLIENAGPVIDNDNPWPGMASYREADERFFKGREHEVDELTRAVCSQRLTVLVGTSGLGKTSLLRAGLFPKLRQRNELPIYVRLDFKSSPAALAEQLFAASRTQAEAAQVAAPVRTGNQSLW